VFVTTRKLPIGPEKQLYCAWIRQKERPGAPLVAVWIDPTMSAFAECAPVDPGAAGTEQLPAWEEG